MSNTILEHVNITVSNPEHTAQLLCDLFGWHIRWQGDAIMGGKTIHVGTSDCYLALYTNKKNTSSDANTYTTVGGLNHIGIVVGDLDETERRVISAGFETFNHADYEPGRRFYFNDHNGIEYEVVSYSTS